MIASRITRRLQVVGPRDSSGFGLPGWASGRWSSLWILGWLIVLSGLPAYGQLQCFKTPSGAIAWWSFDETSGTIAADRIGNNPGIYTNGPIPAAGLVRSALRFNGNNYVTVRDSDLWAFGASDFTIELWANFDAPGGGSVGHPGDIFIGNDEGPFNRNKWFFALGGGYLNFHINSPTIGPKFFPLVPFSPTLGQWYHLAVVRSGSLYTIYVNGEPKGSASNADVIPNPNCPLTIGQAEQLGFMNGRLDEVTIYRRALTREELQATYTSGSAGKCVELSIRPQKGGNTGNVSATISGIGFGQGATAKLVRPGQPDIVGNPVTVANNGTTIDTTFDLAGKDPGARDLVIANPDGTTFVLANGFAIETGSAPQVWVDVVGPGLFRPGRPQTFHVLYGNRGNVDARGVLVWIAGIPKSSTWKLSSVIGVPEQADGENPIDWSRVPIYIESGDEVVLPLLVPVIAPDSVGTFTIELTIPAAQAFQLQAWASRPLSTASGIFDGLCSQWLDNSWFKCLKSVLALALEERLPGISVASCVDSAIESVCAATRGKVPISFPQIIAKGMYACLVAALDLSEDEFYKMFGEIFGFAMDFISTVQDCSEAFLDLFKKVLDVFPINSFDPNDKVGSRGAGDSKYLSGVEPLRYAVFFENLATATGPAQEVVISDQLDATKMDLSTLSLGPIAFGNKVISPSLAQNTATIDVDLRPGMNLIARVFASLNPNTGLLTWRFTSIDPATGKLTENPLAGFLPPNKKPPEGEGSVGFTVMPKKGLETGTQIRNRASIVFDLNAPIQTPEWVNTIDNTKPASQVLPLTGSSCTAFDVRWEGSDTGAGIRDYTIFVSRDHAPLVKWLSSATSTHATFQGIGSHSYAFYSQARDSAGNLEDLAETPDVTIDLPAALTLSSKSLRISSAGGTGAVNVMTSNGCSWTATSDASWIEVLSGHSGSGDGTVRYVVTANLDSVSRRGTLDIAGQTFSVIQENPSGTLFADVPAGYWAYDYIAAIFAAAITNGCGNGRYCPDDVITREQMAAFLIRTIEGEQSNRYCNSGSRFEDVPPNNIFCGDIKRLSELEITRVAGNYMPKDPVTRGQMSAFLIRTLYGEEFTHTASPYFSDVPSNHGFFKYVQKMKDMGLTQVSGVYFVDRVLTRAEMSAFLARAFLHMP